MINIIIADDHAIVKMGIELIFNSTPDLRIVDYAINGNGLIEKITKNNYDIVILDISMPYKDGFDTLKEIKLIKPFLPVIIYTMNPEETYWVRMYKNGASAFVNKESSPMYLIDVVRKVINNKLFITSRQQKLIDDYSAENEVNNIATHETLTDREFQVMVLLAGGIGTSEIANSLMISKNAVSNHRNSILKKLNLNNNSELTRYAIQNKIIQ